MRWGRRVEHHTPKTTTDYQVAGKERLFTRKVSRIAPITFDAIKKNGGLPDRKTAV